MKKELYNSLLNDELVLDDWPVLMMLFLTMTPLDALIWIPSVLGLKAGAITLRLEATTRRQFVKATCICWLSITNRWWIFTFLHLWKVMACNRIVKMSPCAATLFFDTCQSSTDKQNEDGTFSTRTTHCWSMSTRLPYKSRKTKVIA